MGFKAVHTYSIIDQKIHSSAIFEKKWRFTVTTRLVHFIIFWLGALARNKLLLPKSKSGIFCYSASTR